MTTLEERRDGLSGIGEPAIRPKVFVSYSRKDTEFAEALVAELTQHGFEAYLDTKVIAPGEPWQERLAALIVKADAIAFAVSPDSVDPRSVCDWELNEAERLSKRIIPVVCRPVPDADVPRRLKRLNYVFLTPDRNRDSQIARLVDGLKVDIRWVRQHTDIGEAAERWSQPGQGGDHFLLQGKAISDAELWISSHPADAPKPTDVQRAFIKASREAEIARAEKEQRQIARTRWFQRVVGLLLVFGIVGVIWQSIQTTKREQVVFTSRAAEAAQSGHHDRALRLALQSYPADGDWWWTPQAESLTDLLAGNAVASRLIVAHQRPTNTAVTADKTGWWVSLEDKERGAINLWQPQTNEIVLGHARDLTKFYSFAVSHDHRYELIMDNSDATAHIRDFASGRLVSTLAKFGSPRAAAFSRDGEKVVITGENNTAGIYNAVSGIRIGAPLMHAEFVEVLAISPNGKVVATGDPSGAVRLWNAADGSLIRAYKIESSTTAIAFSSDGRVLAVGDADGGLSLWGVATEGKLANLVGHRDRIWSINFSGDGERLATSSSDQSIIIWDAAAKSIVLTLRGAQLDAVFSTDGQTLLTRSNDHFRIWDVANKLPQAEKATVWMPDDRQSKGVAVENPYSQDPFLTLAYVNGFKVSERKKLECHSAQIAHWLFSRAGDRLLTVSSDKTACIWSVADGKLIHKLNGHDSRLTHGAFSADGKYVATTSEDRTARIYDAESGAGIVVLRGHTDWVTGVDFMPDGKGLVTTSNDRTTKLWDLSGKKIEEILLDDRGVAARFSPTGGQIAILTSDGEIVLWNAITGAKLASLRGIGSQLLRMNFSLDGKRLLASAVTALSKSEHVWDLTWLDLSGSDLRKRICTERLAGAHSFANEELSDPILAGIDAAVPTLRNPCLRHGPLHWRYYTQSFETWRVWAKQRLSIP
ncbi:MAG: TIR domain-containing protein [Hyphomicrobiaceae bacterium]